MRRDQPLFLPVLAAAIFLWVGIPFGGVVHAEATAYFKAASMSVSIEAENEDPELLIETGPSPFQDSIPPFGHGLSPGSAPRNRFPKDAPLSGMNGRAPPFIGIFEIITLF